MASFVKSIDSNHLLTVGMEGFYGESMPEKKAINPGYQVGTDFIAIILLRRLISQPYMHILIFGQ